MKSLFLFTVSLFCFVTISFSQQSKNQRWEHSAYLVKKEHYRLMRLEITSDSLLLNDNTFNNLQLTLLNKEGIIDVVLVDPSLVRVYYLDFVALDTMKSLLNPFYGNPILGNIIQLYFDSQEIQDVMHH